MGVTRQTVYRYFPSLADLLYAVAETGAADFIDRMQRHLATVRTPVDAVTESIVFALQELPRDPRIGLLLQADDQTLVGRGVTTSTAFDLGTRVLQSTPVDWEAIGVRDEDFAGLAELTMRLMVSFLQHPSVPPRSPDELRTFVRRWLQPALAVTTGPE